MTPISPWRSFRIVSAKERRELLRDRKTLFWLLMPPFILPAIAIVAALFIGTQTARYITQGFPVSIKNEQAAPAFVDQLKKSKALIVLEDGNDRALIRLTIPDDFQAQIDGGRSARLILTRRDNSFGTTLAVGAMRAEINGYNDALFRERLRASGKDVAWLTPIVTDESEAAATARTSVTTQSGSSDSSASSGGISGFGVIFLPLAVTSWLIGGGLGLVVDTTVGEKERQTIESILVTPASRLGIVAGKLSVVFIVSFVVMGLWMVEGVALTLLGDAGPKLLAAEGASTSALLAIVGQSASNLATTIAFLVILIIPFIILLNSLVMIFCSVAGSYRESNVFLFMLQLVLPAMVLLAVFAIGPDAGPGWYAAPIMGTITAIRDLFSQTLTASGLLISVVSTSVYAVAALGVASYTYSRDWSLTRGI